MATAKPSLPYALAVGRAGMTGYEFDERPSPPSGGAFRGALQVPGNPLFSSTLETRVATALNPARWRDFALRLPVSSPDGEDSRSPGERTRPCEDSRCCLPNTLPGRARFPFCFCEATPPMAIDPEFLRILACPACKSELVLKEENRLVCVRCRRSYPIRDGFPVLLIEEATIEEEEAKDETTTA